jgi:hypothetical protein
MQNPGSCMSAEHVPRFDVSGRRSMAIKGYTPGASPVAIFFRYSELRSQERPMGWDGSGVYRR